MPDADYTNPTADLSDWQHGMSVPHELHVKEGKLLQTPIRELEKLRTNHISYFFYGNLDQQCTAMSELLIENHSNAFQLSIGTAAKLSWAEGLFKLELSKESGFGRTCRYLEMEQLKNLQILMDTSSLEIFFNDGEQVMSTRFYPQGAETKQRTLSFVGLGSVQQYELKPMQIEWIKWME